MWKPPDHGFFKLNSNNAICDVKHIVGVGIVIRNEKGSVFVSGAIRLLASYPPLVAKACAIFCGIRLSL